MTQHPEGRLLIHLDRGTDGRVEVRLQSSRPFAAVRWFEGKTVDETLRVLPMLYRICGTAQAVAAVTAVEDARQDAAPPAQIAARQMLVLAETLREHLLRILSGWRDSGDQRASPPTTDISLALVMQLPLRLRNILFPENDAFVPGGGRLVIDAEGFGQWLDQVRQLVGKAVLGMPDRQWQALSDAKAILEWAGSSPGAAAAFVRTIADRDWCDIGATQALSMPALDPKALAARMDDTHGMDFAARPDWNGEVYETGAFARMADHPLVAAARQAWGDGLMARTLARLAEVASLPDLLAQACADASADAYADSSSADSTRPAEGSGIGIAQVEAARGRLVHHIILDGDRIARYRMLAPTEWNFHPRGVLARALGALPVDHEGLEHLAALWVEAVDPCVGYDLQVSTRA